MSQLVQIVQIVVPTIFSMIFLVGLIGNSMIVMAVTSNRKMWSTANFLVLNLALADLIFIIFCVPFTAVDYVVHSWPFGWVWCKFVQYSIIVAVFTSGLTLVLMSAWRFLAVVYPLESISIRTKRNTIFAIGVTWLVTLTLSLPVGLAHGVVTTSWGGTSESFDNCTLKPEYDGVAFQLIFALMLYGLPLAIITILYLCILTTLRNGSLGTEQPSHDNSRSKAKKNASRLIIIVTLVYALCGLPIHIVLILKSLDLYSINDLTIGIQITAHVMFYMNPCLNPILYAGLSEHFRTEFLKILNQKCNYFRQFRSPSVLENIGNEMKAKDEETSLSIK